MIAASVSSLDARIDEMMARAERMVVRASSAKAIDAILAVSLAVRELRTGLTLTAPTDPSALGDIQGHLARLEARLDDIERAARP